MNHMHLYKTYAQHLQQIYGQKVYKLPIHLKTGCPNRDGLIGLGGCDFCAENGAGFELLPDFLDVKQQIARNMEYIGKKYKTTKFIAYFQNFSNTYLPFEEFKAAMLDAVHPQIVEYAISTRPDCLEYKHLDFLQELVRKHGIRMNIELGLQTANYHTLHKMNRGHGLGAFIDAVMKTHEYKFEVCAHVILNLPGDELLDTLETARILSALKVEQVKLHALYIMDKTKLGDDFKEGVFSIITAGEYRERVIQFLEHLHPNIAVQRLIGRAPEENSLFVNWGMSWWKIRDEIHNTMTREGRKQGTKSSLTVNPLLSKCD